MTTIPPSATPPPLVSAAGPATISAVLTQVPAGLTSSSPGTVITGTIAAVDGQGQAVLQTNAGPVVLQTSAALAVGEQISLQLQPGGGAALKATILAAEAVAAADMAAAASTDSMPEAAAPTTATPATTVAPSVASGPVIVATVIGPATVPSSPPQGTTPAPSSSPPPSAAAVPRSTTPPAAGATPPSAPPPSVPARAGMPPISTAPASTSAQPTNTSSSSPASPAPLLPGGAAEPPPVATPAATTSPPPASPLPQSVTAPGTPENVPASDAPPSPSSLPPATPAAPPTPAPLAAAAPLRQLATAIASYTASSATPGASGLQTSAPSPANPGTTSPFPAPPTGTQVPLRLAGPLASLASAAASASSGQVVATVVGQTPAGQTIVDTAIGRLAFTAPPMTEIAIGQQIALEIAAPGLRPGAETMTGSPALAAGRGLATLGAEWPSLGDALSTLAKIDPELAEQVMQTAAAHPDSPQFLGQVLSFLASPAEDVRQLLGRAAVDLLQRAGRGDILNHLDADLRAMNRLNASATDWQVFYVPLFDSTEARQLRVFTRRHKASDKRGRDSGGRFIVDVEFEALGPLQLDGLVQKPRLDLILRSHDELPAALQSGIVDVFGKTCEAAGLQGQIFFQAGPTFPVAPLDEMTRSSPSDLSV